MIDGQSTVDLLNERFGVELCVDDAITLEMLLFGNLKTEVERLKVELAAEKAGHPGEHPLSDEPMDRQIVLLNRQVGALIEENRALAEENRRFETNRNFLRDQINRAIDKIAPNCPPMTLEAAADRIVRLCEEAARGCVERWQKISELNRKVEKQDKEIEILLAFNDRLLSLVRYARQELHQQDAISDAEYAALVSHSGYREVLETHDSLRTQLEAAQARIAELEGCHE